MAWQKLGKLYQCSGLHPKLKTHAANPLAIHLEDDTFRIYFSARDEINRSSVGAVDINIITKEIIREFNQPLFEHGKNNSFYSHGVSIGNIYSIGNTKYMLFMGWQNPNDSHWFGEIGRLIVNNDLSLTLESKKPYMPLDKHDPISLSYPWVQNINGKYQMWYGSTLSWDAGNNEMLHAINYAESNNGDSWTKRGLAIPYARNVVQAFSRPTVLLRKSGDLTMWFSCRGSNGEKYYIGESKSSDGKNWSNVSPTAGLNVSTAGWDSEMVEYPFVFEHDNEVYMLYNGNGFGKTGFGLAILKENN